MKLRNRQLYHVNKAEGTLFENTFTNCMFSNDFKVDSKSFEILFRANE